MIKYTGFGNAAGLLANEGLLGGGGPPQPKEEEDSPDEDSKHCAGVNDGQEDADVGTEDSSPGEDVTPG